MITKIKLQDVASYKKETHFLTDKKINLIYGLNGTGKSTFSSYLYDLSNPDFKNCNVYGILDEEIVTYNQKFISDFFYEEEKLKGIFTLSKENKAVAEKIRNIEIEIEKYRSNLKDTLKKQEDSKNDDNEIKQKLENKCWEIKTKFSGGDRVLDYCLTGLMGRKEALTNHLLSTKKPDSEPNKTIETLKKEIESINSNVAQKYSFLPLIENNFFDIESNTLLQKPIVGNENAIIANLINTLGNSDWVFQGLKYLPDEIPETGIQCPFCQETTISKNLSNEIINYFDATYKNELDKLKNVHLSYKTKSDQIQPKERYEANPFIIEKSIEFELAYTKFFNLLVNNLKLIEEKIRIPSQIINLASSQEEIASFNSFIDEINKQIKLHNEKIDDKENTLLDIKNQFWSLMRWDFDGTINSYHTEKKISAQRIEILEKDIIKINGKLTELIDSALEEQRKTVNIEEAIQNINNGLVELGIDSFKIIKHSENLYRIARENDSRNAFFTLSEGEKMVISFLYFRELCKGKKDPSSTNKKKIIIIDDPISSLSHIFIYNIGILIKNEFFNSDKYEQVIVLTHSLYFFYELTDINHDRRKLNQNLYRITKNEDGSKITSMKYEDIQNDYQAYWSIIKDPNHPPALLANAMRNIVEYFFNFIEKKDLSNVQQIPILQESKYQAFFRYINRESHSLGQNIFDFKEFNYDDFREALRCLFISKGYEEHYKKMIS
ncbi:AAA family ATPase [Leptospira bouyouniensis]|uniref:Protein CR006 P-loop domain-containing protein n=1 Tax=Leptospira bouyouniensis TaxID=2484911 RepID=A0ABY2L9L8_9LEPT|nr:AAA family ATPase [Leptospira bouyouniensis]TGK54190.1 hypothetical protein EHQ10_00010 [Leptospira bouyouniensis]